MCPFFEKTGCPCDDVRRCTKAHGFEELRNHDDPINKKLLDQYTDYDESFRVSIYGKEASLEEEKGSLSQSDTLSYNIDQDDQTEDIIYLKTVIANLKNERSTL